MTGPCVFTPSHRSHTSMYFIGFYVINEHKKATAKFFFFFHKLKSEN